LEFPLSNETQGSRSASPTSSPVLEQNIRSFP
jgi:hypothetical protein